MFMCVRACYEDGYVFMLNMSCLRTYMYVNVGTVIFLRGKPRTCLE
jgi:hypothetical protein